jgi:hypothetical protein
MVAVLPPELQVVAAPPLIVQVTAVPASLARTVNTLEAAVRCSEKSYYEARSSLAWTLSSTVHSPGRGRVEGWSGRRHPWFWGSSLTSPSLPISGGGSFG